MRRGRIFNPTFFFTNSIAPRSSVSSIATSRAVVVFLNATMLFFLAIGSGMRDKTSKSIFCSFKLTNGMPRMYASVRRRSSSESFPPETKMFPRYALLSSACFSARSSSVRGTSPESAMNSLSCLLLTVICFNKYIKVCTHIECATVEYTKKYRAPK